MPSGQEAGWSQLAQDVLQEASTWACQGHSAANKVVEFLIKEFLIKEFLIKPERPIHGCFVSQDDV